MAAFQGYRRSPVASAGVRVSTRRGDDGTTGLLYGGRVAKRAHRTELNGAVDEAQAALGLARTEPGSERDELLVRLERLSDLLWVMARWQEGESHVAARTGRESRRTRGGWTAPGRPEAGEGAGEREEAR